MHLAVFSFTGISDIKIASSNTFFSPFFLKAQRLEMKLRLVKKCLQIYKPE